MELSCKSEYAFLALLELASRYASREPVQVRQIASQQEIPDRYLEQLLATLRRAAIVRSQRGAKGGYLLAREPHKITLLDVVRCIEGVEPEPGQRSSHGTVERSIILEVWQEAWQSAELVLQGYTLQDLCDRRDARQQLDIMYYI